MNRQLFLLLSILFFVSVWPSMGQTKHALIIAIGKYPNPEKNGWAQINSENDVPLIKNSLLNNGFAENKINMLLDQKATKAGILAALDKLITTVAKDSKDIVVIHISSHGVQLEDNDSNEEADGLDEAIVTYGAVYATEYTDFKKYEQGYLRDDDFGDKIAQLRNKLGKDGDLLVVVDACHSGTVARGGGDLIRGGKEAMLSSNFSSRKKGLSDEKGVFKDANTTQLSADASSYVVISGAEARQSNFECRDENNNRVGSLSYSFSQALMELKDKGITYRNLFAAIENIMRDKAPRQKPAIEGDGLNRGLFGGEYFRQKPYSTIDVAASNENLITLNSGFLSGITKESKVGFYPLETTDPAGKTALLTGVVTEVDNFTCKVKPDNAPGAILKQNPKVFVTEYAYTGAKVKIDAIDDQTRGNDKSALDKVKTALKDFQLVEFSTNYDLYMEQNAVTNKWALKYRNTGGIFQDNISLDDQKGVDGLKQALTRFDRLRYLRNLNMNEEDLNGKIDLLFLDASGNIDSAKIKERTKDDRLELKVGDVVFLQIINIGKKPFYINVVDIQPDGMINRVLPNSTLKDKNGKPAPLVIDNCYVRIGDTLLMKSMTIKIGPPYGDETFKVFLTTTQMNLEEILTSTDEENEQRSRGGTIGAMAKVFINSKVNKSGKRGVDTDGVPATQSGTVFNYNFVIAK